MVKLRWLLVFVLVVTLSGCRKAETPDTSQVNEEGTAESQMDQFLTERGITLAPGVERASLSGSDGSGIATREIAPETQNYSVIADLPTPTSGAYVAWLKKSDGAVVTLGGMRYEKGGFMLEKSTTEDWSGYTQIEVSQENGIPKTPTTVVLSGSF